MAQLTTLKQRIKTIVTIKKTTNAMRLISMSHHTRMRQIKNSFDTYKNELIRIYNKKKDMKQEKNTVPTENKTKEQIINNQNNTHHEKAPNNAAPIIYIIGAQKGVCGTFNTFLLHFVKKDIEQLQSKNIYKKNIKPTAYTVGKQLHEQTKEQKIIEPIFLTTITTNTIKECVATIIKKLSTEKPGQSIFFYANYPKTFFIQRPIKTILTIPVATDDPVATKLDLILFNAEIQSIVINSLLAEHAARFVSMDTSTQNADKIITQLKLDYNKLRQALITRELTELTTTLGMLEE